MPKKEKKNINKNNNNHCKFYYPKRLLSNSTKPYLYNIIMSKKNPKTELESQMYDHINLAPRL